MNKPTTDDGDDYIEPDVQKRFGLPEQKKPSCFVVAGAIVVVLILLALAAYWIIGSL